MTLSSNEWAWELDASGKSVLNHTKDVALTGDLIPRTRRHRDLCCSSSLPGAVHVRLLEDNFEDLDSRSDFHPIHSSKCRLILKALFNGARHVHLCTSEAPFSQGHFHARSQYDLVHLGRNSSQLCQL